jgi:SagB-type dehydrogenase family enzyme
MIIGEDKMKNLFCILSVVFVFASILVLAKGDINLLSPSKDLGLTKLLMTRHSVRELSDKALSLEQLSNILWAGQGINASGKKRTTASARATYPLKIYVMVKNVTNVEPGIYLYDPKDSKLTAVPKGEKKTDVVTNAVKQDWIAKAPAVILIAYAKPDKDLGEKTVMFVSVEAGAVMQNVYLMAVALGLGTCAVGGYDAKSTKEFFLLKPEEEPILMLPVGIPAP